MEILELVHSVTGLSGIFTHLTAGNFFDVMWIIGAQSGAEADTANKQVQNDPAFVGLMDKSGDFFVPGSAQRLMIMQMP